MAIFYPLFKLGGATYEKFILQPIMIRRVLLGTSLYFFMPWGLSLQKSPHNSLLSHFRLSKHETTSEFIFLRLIKLNDEGPFMGINPSFLRFIKHMRMDSSLDEIHRAFVTLFKLIKNQIGTHHL